MKTFAMAASALTLLAGAATAGGIDRSRLSYGILYEEGNYAEFGLSHVAPKVSGAYAAAFGGGSTGDMANDYTTWSLSYKHQFSDKLHFGLFVNTPYGADAQYTQGAYTGLNATWDSRQIAGVLRYEVTPAVSVYGGLRYVQSEANIQIPPALHGALYTASGDTADVGYIVGAAYEKPEIALRVALTYESGITHDFPTTESGARIGGTFNTTTTIEMPKSIALDFQSGIAKDTLLFGSIRWTEWSAWHVRPPRYFGAVGDEITGFDNDVLTYQLGVGRRLNENFAVFARIGYEKANGGDASRLAPTDGSRSIGIGGTYTKDNLKITGGIEYVKLGDATDSAPTRTVFSGNDAIGFGVTVGIRF
jgi:long-subunit fatty acid transport protein